MITPVLLCGGSGTRLWPLSRKSYPKQFVPLLGETTLFQATAQRLVGDGFAPPLVLTNAEFRFIVTQQLSEAGIDPGPVLIEPQGRNTAPAILAAALHLAHTEPDALMLVAPSDHVLPDEAAFRAAIAIGTETAQAGRIVTFGIHPGRPETGYGYLECSRAPSDGAAQPLKGFVEKPDAARAAEMLAAGTFLWNAGIFLTSVRGILEAFDRHAPDLRGPVHRAVEQAVPDLGFLRLAPGPWAKTRDVSIDYAVMEHAENLSVVPLDAGWSDLGDWEAVWRETSRGAARVSTFGPTTVLDCENTLLHADDPEQEVVGLGLRNIIVVAMSDAVLVADRNRAQAVKDVVAALKAGQAPQAERFPKMHRPWGWRRRLLGGAGFQVNQVMLNPGRVVALQSHTRRAEHWVVVSGEVRVAMEGETRLLHANQSLYVPQGARHRLENPGPLAMEMIEVQTGDYLGADDVIRYEQPYAPWPPT
ncbi:MAG: mannose-1-phosphate guanylyltransferase/mannose-6-phosphate isomerase [Methylocystaceae bacterium]|nr:mannose-1-phosphate guanylyltransferase/mannose-6-phosphate isomerase [Methylocystaceae bacterium]